MRIVTTTSVFERGYDAKKAQDRLAAHGFSKLDMAFDYFMGEKSPFLRFTYLFWARSLRRRAKKLGVEYTHSHAPWGDEGYKHIARSIKATAAIGARYMVLHPTYTDENGAALDDEESFIRRNADFVRPWLGLAKRCGVVILSENLLAGPARDPGTIARLVKTVDSPYFGWCYDTGHAHLYGFRPEELAGCAVCPLSLHLQDNNGGGDEHLIPGDGEIDFDSTMKTLRAIGYAGDCVLEAHKQCLNAPDGERGAVLDRLYAAGEALCAKFKE